jgi:hypothetical protein
LKHPLLQVTVKQLLDLRGEFQSAGRLVGTKLPVGTGWGGFWRSPNRRSGSRPAPVWKSLHIPFAAL